MELSSSRSYTVALSDNEQSKNISRRFQRWGSTAWDRYKKKIGYSVLILFLIGYTIYFGFALAHSVSGALALIVITCIVIVLIIYNVIKRIAGDWIWKHLLRPCKRGTDKQWFWLKWVLSVLFVVGVIIYLIFWVVTSIRQLQSISGFVIFLLIPWITSKYNDQIKWRPVLWGVALQFIMGILVLRWHHGYQAIKFVADEINKFLFYSLEGAAGVFGDPFFILHPLAFVVCPLVIYLGAVMAIFYYTGLTQLVASKTAWLMQKTLQISAVESLSLTANVFLSVVDTMLLLRNYIPKLTKSEFHTFLVGSHATIAGFAFGLFVVFGVSPQHLLTGAVMSAPAAVAIAKLNFPETEESVLKEPEDVRLERGPEVNVIEAASDGAMVASRGVVSIMIQVLAFVSIYVFLNTTVTWLGARIGVELTMEIILSYVFMPVAFLMGVDWSETQKVSRLLGVKVLFNEVLAFLDLGEQRRLGEISDRSATIATYAMCGFSSIGTLSIFVGVWSSVDAKRVPEVAKQLPRVLINANLSCFLTACIASLLYNEEVVFSATTAEPSIIWDILGLIPSYSDILNMFQT